MKTQDLASAEIGECIYCRGTSGDSNFSSEHVIPQFLRGTLECKNGSCEVCRKITHRFESKLGGVAFRPYRVAAGFKISKPKEIPKAFPLLVRKTTDIGKEKILLPVEDHPAGIQLPHFPYPGLLVGRVDSNWPQCLYHYFYREAIVPDAHKKSLATYTEPYFLGDFVRLLAKIAHGLCVLRFGLKGFRPCLVPLILGEETNYTLQVGSMPYFTPPGDEQGCEYSFHEFWHSGFRLILVRIRLFGNLGKDADGIGPPTFLIVAGDLPIENPNGWFFGNYNVETFSRNVFGMPLQRHHASQLD